MRQILLLLPLIATQLSAAVPADQVFVLRAEHSVGSIELSTAVAISPDCAVSLGVFLPDAPVSLETPDGILLPDTVIASQDLGLRVLVFEEAVFPFSQMPSETVPPYGEPLIIIGQGLSGTLTVEGEVLDRSADGAILVSAPVIDGMMGAAVFDTKDKFVGLITGVIEPDGGFLNITDADEFLVLYPSQIWYMWAQLASIEEDIPSRPFGVTAMSSISLSEDRPSGIQLVSVLEGSEAWNIGLRPGDLITMIDGIPVYHPETLRGLRVLSPDTLEAVVWCRDGVRDVYIPAYGSAIVD